MHKYFFFQAKSALHTKYPHFFYLTPLNLVSTIKINIYVLALKSMFVLFRILFYILIYLKLSFSHLWDIKIHEYKREVNVQKIHIQVFYFIFLDLEASKVLFLDKI